MNNIVLLVLISIAGYLIGALPTAYLIVRMIHRVNIFEVGSGNMGGTNVARAMGIPWGVATIAIDACKGMAAVYLAQRLMPVDVMLANSIDARLLGSIIAALFAVIGHNWSIFATGLYTYYNKEFKVRGGKGAATAFGTMIMLLPPTPVVLLLGLGVGLALITRYASLSVLISFAVSMIWTMVWAVQHNGLLFVLYIVAIAVLMLFRFRENIQRLVTGTERRIGEPG